MCGSSVPVCSWCVTHLEGFRFASICLTGFLMHFYVDDELLVCLWLLGSTKMKLQLSSSTRCINNEGPTLNLATGDGASHPGQRGCSMSSLLHHGSIRTAAVEQVVAPMATHLCHLVLLCDSEGEAGQFSQLEGAAQGVAKATEDLAAVACR